MSTKLVKPKNKKIRIVNNDRDKYSNQAKLDGGDEISGDEVDGGEIGDNKFLEKKNYQITFKS